MDSFTLTTDYAEEDVDMFAELGASRPHSTPAQTAHTSHSVNQFDPLAAFMEDDDEQVLTADSMFSMSEEQDGGFTFIDEPVEHSHAQTETTEEVENIIATPVMSGEVITELLEVLVKKELEAREQRGENWLSELPAEAIAQIESAKVIKNREAYHLSLIIDMVGTGQVRPFATVLSTGDGPLPVSPPAQIPSTWQPLYNALREILMQAMHALSSINVGASKASV